MKHVEAKLGKMRKPQQFVVQLTDKGNFIVQSDKSIGQFDMNTGHGLLNTKGCYFHHLTKFLGAEEYQFPADFVQQCHAAFALKGDLIGASAETGPVYYGGITEIPVKPARQPILSDTTDWCAFSTDYVPGVLDYGRACRDSGYTDVYYGGDFCSYGSFISA